MPELPEVETVKRAITPFLLGKEILSVEFYRASLRNNLPYDKLAFCINATILSIERKAKYIVLNLSTNYSIIIHLGMTGSLMIYDKNYLNIKHDHVRINLENNSLVLNDPRRFGVFDLLETKQVEYSKYFKSIGPDPFDEHFSEDYLLHKLRKKNLSIKAALMDNSIVVGVGNIYASEALFKAGIHPQVPSSALSLNQLKKLVESIKVVLKDAIDAGGSTIKDYKTPGGGRGGFQNKFSVYGRSNKKCFVCEALIEKIKISGRATYFCPKCQSN